MLIKYGTLDVTDRLLEYKFSGAFANGYLIGNVPTLQLNLKFDNYDGILDNLNINEYWEVQETDNSVKRYFKVYDQPEKYTKKLSLKLYDDAHELDMAYDTKLSYPVTINDQLQEISSLTGFTFNTINLPAEILNKEVAWYDNTIAIRNYLGWIAEISGCNLFTSGKKSFTFELLTNDISASTDTLTNYEKNELYRLTRVYAENGINPLMKGDTTGNTLFLDPNNLYITDDQSIIDRIYDQLNGLEFYSVKSVDMISIDNLLPGKLINYNDEFSFMVIDIENVFKGGDFLYCSIDGTVTTKNEERIIKKISNTTRIRKLQVKQDQQDLKLSVIAQEVDDNNKKIGELIVSNEEINSKIDQIENNVVEIDTSLFTYELHNTGTIIKSDSNVTLSAHVFNKGEDVTDTLQDIAFCWIKENDTEWNDAHKRMKSVTLTPDDVYVSANFYCQITMSFGIQRTQSITVNDETDVADLRNSYLDVSGASHIQQLDNETYFPDWTKTNAVLTPCVVDGLLNIDIGQCIISYKRIEDGVEVDLGEGETVKNGILTISRNLMTKDKTSLDYVCYVTYKNATIKLYRSYMLNIVGQDSIIGKDGTGIVSVSTYYAVSSSNTKPPAEGWTTAEITRAEGQYLWMKTVTKFDNNTSSESTPVMITGDRGDDGIVKSETAPDDTSVMWFDTTDNLLKRWDGESWEVVNDYASDIQNVKEQITTEYNSEINQLKESITSLVEQLQTTTTDNTQSVERLVSQIEQNATSISLITSSVSQITDNISGLATKEEISQWARFYGEGENAVLELGASDSPFAVKLSNTELGFYQNGTRIAYLSNQQLNISQAVVMQMIQFSHFQMRDETIDNMYHFMFS